MRDGGEYVAFSQCVVCDTWDYHWIEIPDHHELRSRDWTEDIEITASQAWNGGMVRFHHFNHNEPPILFEVHKTCISCGSRWGCGRLPADLQIKTKEYS